MKHQIFFSPDADTSGSSDAVKRLAERYNIPEKDVQSLLYGSRAPKPELGGSSMKEKPMPEPTHTNRGWSPLVILSLVVGILGVMALTIILIHVIRDGGHHEFPPRYAGNMPAPPPPVVPAPTMPVPDTSKPENSSMNQVPQPAPPSAAQTMPAPRYTTPRHSASGFSTSNSIEAQEHLAELRAGGNSKARIHASKKHGVTFYNIR